MHDDVSVQSNQLCWGLFNMLLVTKCDSSNRPQPYTIIMVYLDMFGHACIYYVLNVTPSADSGLLTELHAK